MSLDIKLFFNSGSILKPNVSYTFASSAQCKFGQVKFARSQVISAHNLNLNSLRVKRQIDNPLTGAVTGEISA